MRQFAVEDSNLHKFDNFPIKNLKEKSNRSGLFLFNCRRSKFCPTTNRKGCRDVRQV